MADTTTTQTTTSPASAFVVPLGAAFLQSSPRSTLAATSARSPHPASASSRLVMQGAAAAEKLAAAAVPVSGLVHLAPDAAKRAAESKSKFEKLKVQQDGSAMWTQISELAAILRKGDATWEDIDGDNIELRFKWAGLFHRKKRTPGLFMMRLKVPNGILSSVQMRYLGSLVAKYGDAGCLDITTRMNIQLRGIPLEDSPGIFTGLQDHGLSAFMSGMDNVRNLVGSPIAGIDPHEQIDTRQLCIDINDMITDGGKGNPEFSNLPRKFNITVSGSRDDFAHTHINDLGFIPAEHPTTGQMGFNVIVGGLFSIKRNEMSITMDTWVPPEDVVALSRAVLEVFRDNGERNNRQKTRLMYLLDTMGIETFRDAVGAAMGRADTPLERAVPENYAEPFERRDLLGVHAQKQEGFSWVGILCPAGRFYAEDAIEIARLADVYSQGEVRMTVEQNFIFPNVLNEKVEELLAEPLLAKYRPNPGNLSRGLVSCTGAQFCGVALIETKNRAMALVEELEKLVELPKLVRMHWTGCPNSCAQVQVGELGFMGAPARKNGKAVEGVNIFMGGVIGEDPKLGKIVRKGVPCDFEELVPAVRDILVEEFGGKLKAASGGGGSSGGSAPDAVTTDEPSASAPASSQGAGVYLAPINWLTRRN